MIEQPEGLQQHLLNLPVESRRWVLELSAEIQWLRIALETFADPYNWLVTYRETRFGTSEPVWEWCGDDPTRIAEEALKHE